MKVQVDDLGWQLTEGTSALETSALEAAAEPGARSETPVGSGVFVRVSQGDGGEPEQLDVSARSAAFPTGMLGAGPTEPAPPPDDVLLHKLPAPPAMPAGMTPSVVDDPTTEG